MRVGVLGAGQLGRMLALAGHPLGMCFDFFDPAADACAGAVGTLTTAPWDDARAVRAFASRCDVVTYEFENVPLACVREAMVAAPVYPPPAALEAGQDRFNEKTLFVRSGLSVHPFTPCDTPRELLRAVESLGAPLVVKTRRGGYDGKGQLLVRAATDAEPAWRELGGVPLLAEQLVRFERELSVIGVRGRDGSFVAYPLTENTHRSGILRTSIAPASNLDGPLAEEAVGHVRTLMESLGYVGVLAVEFFDAGGRLLANEMAPRVHNSGHWTIDGAATSQFENHLRAVAGLPLGSCDARGVSAMVNFIGGWPEPARVLALGAKLHLYGKSPRPGRKVGHATIVADEDDGDFRARLEALVKLADAACV